MMKQNQVKAMSKQFHHLISKFKVPHEVSGVVVAKVVDEFRGMLLYTTQFVSLSSTKYQAVWWKLFHSPDASDWINA